MTNTQTFLPRTVRPTYGRRSDVIRSDIFSSADVVGPVDNMFEDEFETPTVICDFSFKLSEDKTDKFGPLIVLEDKAQ